MDENRVEGAARNIGGKIEDAAGNLTGDNKLKADGMADKVAGSAQRTYGQAADTVRDAANNAGDYGSQLLDQIEEAGDMIAEQIDQRPITALLIAAGVGFLLALATKPVAERGLPPPLELGAQLSGSRRGVRLPRRSDQRAPRRARRRCADTPST